MDIVVRPSMLRGTIAIPGSKSHTIRALVIATLAAGVSRIDAPLVSADTLSCRQGCVALGATVDDQGDHWLVTGVGGQPQIPRDIIDVGNSGTTMNFLIGAASLIDGYSILSGDAQIRRRPVQPLLDALTSLGVVAVSAPRNGCPPVVVQGPLRGGRAQVRGKISQYLSSLLINCPLAPADNEIQAIDLGEKPYVQMTLNWLDRQGIAYEQHNLEHFRVRGNQGYTAFTTRIPADFSSATFFICAAALPGCDIVLQGLDFSDAQGDKAVVDLLRGMGADITLSEQGLHIRGSQLVGAELDLEDIPDALPALAVVGCLARGSTRLRNVAHARLKETDRIATMCRELQAMGADIAEAPDGLTIRESRLHGAVVDSHGDHRIAMALAIAGLAAQGSTRVTNARAVSVTFPEFPALLQQLGASVELSDA